MKKAICYGSLYSSFGPSVGKIQVALETTYPRVGLA